MYKCFFSLFTIVLVKMQLLQQGISVFTELEFAYLA